MGSEEEMAVDPRQLVAGVLTITMFVMLGNMIKRDHFDPAPVSIHGTSKTSELSLPGGDGPWKGDDAFLTPCWSKPVLEEEGQSQGYLTFSLTNGPEYHISQISDAVVVARYLRATLVLPDIRGSDPGDKRGFEDVYSTEKFLKSLDGVVKVVTSLPTGISARNLAVVKVPSRPTEEEIAENIEPVFREKGNIRLVTYFPSVNMKKSSEKKNIDSIACLGMFGTLELQPDVREVIDSMVERLRTLSQKSIGQFVAVDLRVDILEKRSCQESGSPGAKSCYGPQEIADFLTKLGFKRDTVIYLTQARWDSSLDSLKEFFPKTYTKESIMPIDKKAKYLDVAELEKVIDMYICSESDVFVPAISGLFYANVAGKRIASGKTQILVPSEDVPSFASHTNYVSHYVSEKNHFAYSCFC